MEGQRNGAIIGYYIGYKKYNTTAPYIYVTTRAGDAFNLQHTLKHLEKFTRYAVHVQAFNTEGAGPRSEDVIVLTLEDGKLTTSIHSKEFTAYMPSIHLSKKQWHLKIFYI